MLAKGFTPRKAAAGASCLPPKAQQHLVPPHPSDVGSGSCQPCSAPRAGNLEGRWNDSSCPSGAQTFPSLELLPGSGPGSWGGGLLLVFPCFGPSAQPRRVRNRSGSIQSCSPGVPRALLEPLTPFSSLLLLLSLSSRRLPLVLSFSPTFSCRVSCSPLPPQFPPLFLISPVFPLNHLPLSSGLLRLSSHSPAVTQSSTSPPGGYLLLQHGPARARSGSPFPEPTGTFGKSQGASPPKFPFGFGWQVELIPAGCRGTGMARAPYPEVGGRNREERALSRIPPLSFGGGKRSQERAPSLCL